MTKKKIVFIVNPIAGKGRNKKIESQILLYLDLEKFIPEIVHTTHKGHASDLAVQGLQNNVSIIIAVGGDGTINEIIKVIQNTSCVLGIIPTGSGNGLAYHLHIPMKVKKAIQLFNEEHIESIDTVTLNEHTYASIAGIGFDAFIAEEFDKKKKRGFFSYFSLILKYIFIYKSKTYLITTKDNTYKIKAFLICFANSSQWGFNVKISPESSVQDGLVNVCFIKKPSLLSLPFFFLFILSKNLNLVANYVKIYKLSEFRIQTIDAEEMPVHLDGTPLQRQKEFQIKTNPLSLKILLNRRNI